MASLSIDVPTEVAAGAGVLLTAIREKWATVTGTFVATLQLQGSQDGTDWITIWETTTTGFFQVLPTVNYLRVNVSAYTSGTPSVRIDGLL